MPTELELSDIQGFILRGYHMKFVRHFVFRIDDPEAFRSLLARSLEGSEPGFAKFTDAASWGPSKPAYCLNIGFSYEGLSKVTDTSDLEFPGTNFDDGMRSAYKEGAVAAAEWNGDIGKSSPENWLGELGTDAVHGVYSLYTMTEEILAAMTLLLEEAFASGGACAVLHKFDGAAFEDDRVHFGYRDGISQPRVEGGPVTPPADQQLGVESWQFVVQDTDHDHCTYRLKTDRQRQLLANGSFAAFRVLGQDVFGFERFLEANADKIDPELLAAKLCGRWRDGRPLVTAPGSGDEVQPGDFNNFEFKKADPNGLRCPFSSHIRRSNPRNDAVRGSFDGRGEGVRNHRLMRRGMPYGPQYVPGSSEDGIERGLLGLFICADLANQFEFVMREWHLKEDFGAGVPKGKDPIHGSDDQTENEFRIFLEDGSVQKFENIPLFVTTRGSAYLFFPSFGALRGIAGIG